MTNQEKFEAWRDGINPRVLIWLLEIGKEPKDIARLSGEDTKLLDHKGHRLPWTIVYSEWVMAAWTAWAASVGFSRRVNGNPPHQAALLGGHTDAEFDAWLVQRAGLAQA